MKIISAVFILLLFAGCGSSSNMKEVSRKPNLNPGKNAMLVIIRARPFPIMGPVNNYLDSKFIGETRTKTYFSTIVKPGLHYVIAEGEDISAVRMNFKAGRIYYLYQDISSGAWDKNRALSVLTRAEAQKSMSECDYIQYNKKNPGASLSAAKYKQSIKEYNEKAKKNPEDYRPFFKYQGYKP
ncbi:MAG: hypothetical protein JXN64_02000 [Spirochaetes bacterium]|nr:hypothetical protein [Spirochaetota bacterium]